MLSTIRRLGKMKYLHSRESIIKSQRALFLHPRPCTTSIFVCMKLIPEPLARTKASSTPLENEFSINLHFCLNFQAREAWLPTWMQCEILSDRSLDVNLMTFSWYIISALRLTLAKCSINFLRLLITRRGLDKNGNLIFQVGRRVDLSIILSRQVSHNSESNPNELWFICLRCRGAIC